jgi:aspartate kinase
MVSESKGAIQSVIDSLIEYPVRMVSFGGSRHNVSVLIDSKFKKEALQSLNQDLFTW